MKLGMGITIGVGVLAMVGCAAFVKSIPSDVALAACVVDDAAKGDSIAQIADDCETDVPGVISNLLSKKAPQTVQATKAYGEAQRTLSISVTP